MPFTNLQLFLTCVAIWGSTWLVITFQLGSVAPEMSVGYRFLLASAVLFGWCKWRGLALRFAFRHHVDLLLFGAGMFCISYLVASRAETYIVSGMVAVGYSASPMIAMLLSRLFFGTPMKLRVAAGATLGIAGIVCVFWNEFGRLHESRNAELGALFTVLSVIASSLGSMVALRTQKRGFSTWTSMAWGMLYGGLMALATGALLGKPFTFEWTAAYSVSLVYLAVLGSIVTFACYLTLMERLGAAPASYVGVMVPVLALAVSFFFEKFEWGWLTTFGVVLSVAGNVAMLKNKQAG